MTSKFAFPVVLAMALSAAAGALASGVQQAASPPPGPGLTLVNTKCGFCHSTSQVFAGGHTAAEWPDVVQQMVDRGAELTPEEQGVVSTYLATHFSTDKPAASAAPAAPAAPAPPGVNVPAAPPQVTGTAATAATTTQAPAAPAKR